MIEWSTALVLGFAGSLHCGVMCGPLILALNRSQVCSQHRIASRTLYHFGRILSYTTLGFVFGSLGYVAATAGFQRWLSIGVGSVLLLSLLTHSRAAWARPLQVWVTTLKQAMLKRLPLQSLRSQTILGALNGLLPCGLVYVAAVGALATGKSLNGAAYMSVFGLGTLPMMLGIEFAGARIRLPSGVSFKTVSQFVIGAMGLLLILRGMDLGIPYLSPELSAGSAACPHCR